MRTARFNIAKKNNKLQKQSSGGALYKKVFLKILQDSQENTCVRVSFLIKLQVSDLCFPVNFVKF